ncbi:surface lipoprotein assembly modifier [Ursidibacter sp. B-7004-1]
MKKLAVYVTLLSSVVYAETTVERDPQQTNINISSPLEQNKLRDDLLRQQNLSKSNEKQRERKITRYTGKQLVENPEVLEDLFLRALMDQNNAILPTYIELYRYVPNRDESLIEWANAILLRDKNLTDSVSAYRALHTKLPDNDFIRFQLAETLFYNQEFEAAKTQFERLRASEGVSPQDIVVFDNYIAAINRKEEWSFSFGGTFLNDKNLANSAKQGTQVELPNGGVITYASPRQTGQGISAWAGANKQWSFSNGKYVAFDSSLSTKYYWDNKYYNDVNAHLGLGIGYSDAKLNLSLTPYIDKRWYAGGVNSTKSLKQYSNTYGAVIDFSYWLNQKWKYALSYDFGYDMYDRLTYSRQYNGPSHNLSNSMMFLPSAKQYWSLAVDTSKKSAKDETNSYERIGTRLTWGQEWGKGFVTSTTLGVGKRNYKEKTFFGMKQKNQEYSASISLWNKNVHFWGLTPRLTFNYSKTDSNIAIYSYDKKQVLLNVTKSF